MTTSKPPLISVVIPCHNAEKWVAQAMESCLSQDYPSVEVIVYDDGSTDDSGRVLSGFSDRVRILGGPNRGACHARNAGFAASTGEFIQFLDADDLILPEKLRLQSEVLIETGADGIYSDWRHLISKRGASDVLAPVEVAGEQPDLLLALLSGWWISPASPLFRRQLIERTGGWDVSLGAGQDKDFMLRIAMTGADVRYLPGCLAIYRRHDTGSITSSNPALWAREHWRVLNKTEGLLAASGKLKPPYREAFAGDCFRMARILYEHDETLYDEALAKVMELNPGFVPNESSLYNCAWKWLGPRRAERLAAFKKRRLTRRS